MSFKKFLITGGCGFIGSTVVKHLLKNTNSEVCNVDKLTYASNTKSLKCIIDKKNYTFIKADICDFNNLNKIIKDFKPNVIINLAAETHVDRSISNPREFLNTNIIGTYNLLECALNYYKTLNINQKKIFRLLHVSTDEIFGDLENKTKSAREKSSYNPSSPYSASKASSNHLARAWHITYDLPILITNCTNNFGPYQFPEKFIPCVITNALQGKKIPIYGDGLQFRDWLYVDDHVNALIKVSVEGKIGETYNISTNNELKNIEVVKIICKMMDKLIKIKPKGINKYEELITFVKDRPGHDRRYSLNCKKIKSELNWLPFDTFHTGIKKTIKWYLENQKWWSKMV